MNKLINALCLSIVLCAAVFAQADNDEYKKNEFYVGYSNQRIDVGDRRASNGIEVSATRNFNRYFGIKADFSAASRSSSSTYQLSNGTTTNTVTTDVNNSVYNFLVGVQVKDNATKARFKPFAHALVGVAHTRDRFATFCTEANCAPQPTFVGSFKNNDTGFGGAFGGGLDIKVSERIDFRAIQVDYNPVYTRSSFDNNIRISVGIVFK
jgi:opacity protein-like surface antigen